MNAKKWAAIVLAVALLPGLAQPAIAKPRLTIQRIDTGDYPTVRATVSLPPSVAEAGTPRFEVAENGDEAGGVTAARISSGTVPVYVVLVIDTSGSMKGAPLTDAKAAAQRFVESLDQNASVALMSFDDEPTLVSAYTSDRVALTGAIASLEARGETALYDALAEAGNLIPPSEGRSSIVILSDGGDTVSSSAFEKAMDDVRDANAPLYAVALKSQDHNPRALQLLTAATGGRLVPAERSSALQSLFEGIAQEINSAWTVSWTSKRPQTKDIDVDLVATVGKTSASAISAYTNPQLAAAAGQPFVFPEIADDPFSLAAVAGIGFLSVTFLVIGLMLLFVRDRNALSQLRYYDQLQADASTDGTGDQVRARVVEAVGVVAGKRGLTQLANQKLEAAGFSLRPAEYMTGHIIAVIGVGLAFQILTGRMVLAVVAVFVMTVGPLVFIENAAERRRHRFEEQLPDVLSMIAGSLRGGWGTQQAIALAAKEAPAPSSTELKRVETETRLGMPLERALQTMADRMGGADFQAAVTAIAIQREVGGNLAEVLDIVAKTIREREALRRQVSALTAEGRFSAWILIGLPFLIITLLLVINPEYLLSILATTFGVGLLVLGAVLLIVGSFWLYQVTKVEV